MRVLLPLKQARNSKGESNNSLSDESVSGDEVQDNLETAEATPSEREELPESPLLAPLTTNTQKPSTSSEAVELVKSENTASSASSASAVAAAAKKDLCETEPPRTPAAPVQDAKSADCENYSVEATASRNGHTHQESSLDSKPPGAAKSRALNGDSKLPSKKPRLRLVDDVAKKPAALKDPSTMTGGKRQPEDQQWSSNYYEDSREAPVETFYNYGQYENDPASARGDPPSQENEYRDTDFGIALKKRGLEIREQEGDGNCLFRAISLQVYGDPSMHGEVRKRCLDFMEREEEHFSQFVTGEPFKEYIRRKRQDGEHGNNVEIQAISELFNRPVEVFVPEKGGTPLNIFHADYKTGDAPIRLSYHDGNHYNAVVDPLVPTAGLGLGLPGLQPGMADKMQVAKAVAESDQMADQMEVERVLKESQDDQIQRALKESSLSVDYLYQDKAIALSDLDATNFELEQAALESSLHSFRNNEHGRKRASSSNERRRRVINAPPNAAMHPTQSTDVFPASLPHAALSVPPAAAASATVASAAAANPENAARAPLGAVDEYPPTVQELAMNGFELRKVIHAYELIGDNFDDLLTFLMSNAA